MKNWHLILIATSLILASLFTPSAFASVNLTAYMATNGHPVTPVFKFSKTILIDYPNGSELQQELNGKNVTVEFTDDSNHNPNIRSLGQKINLDIANKRQNSSSITNLIVHYETIIHGDNKQARIDYLVTLKPTLENYVINSKSDGTTTLDASWMGFSIKDPVVIVTKQYGDLEINFPLGVIQNQLPYVYDILKKISTENIMKTSLIDASPLTDYPIDKYRTLFDPTFTLDESAGLGYVGQSVPATGFAYGYDDLYTSAPKPKSYNIDFTTDSKYHLTMLDRQSSATIDVEGHANGYFVQGMPAISTSTALVSTCCSSQVYWYDNIPWWVWAGIISSVVISFWIFYFWRFKE